MKKIISAFILILMLCFIGCTQIDFTVKFVVEDEVYKEINTSGSETIAIPQDPVKDGYEFEGWYWDKDIWSKPFTANSLLDTELKNNLNVYAHFISESDLKGIEIKIKDFELIDNENEIYYYKSVSNDIQQFSFGGIVNVNNRASWSLSKDISGNDEIKSKNTLLEIGDNVLYILVENEGFISKQYKVIIHRSFKYIVTFDYSDETIEVEEGELIKEPSTSRIGYKFISWNFDFTKPIESDIKITSNWELIKYSINYNLDGGQNNTKNPSECSVEDNIKLMDPVKSGYDFLGWFIDKDFTTKITEIVDTTDTINLYARWVFSFKYSVKDNECIITGYTGKANKLIIPDSIEDCKVTTIGKETFLDNEKLEEIKLPESIKKIDEGAFNGCRMLNTINLPNNVNEIGPSAFKSCSSLESIKIPKNIIKINDGTFEHCSSLTYVDLPISLKEIDQYAFAFCINLYSIILPYGLEYIGSNAFCSCNEIYSIEIPDTVKTIETFAFYECENLIHVDLPISVENIGIYAFGESPLLTIYCEAKTRLDGWSENWQSGALVIWDYKSYTK